jgi:benzoate membrane transport protein
MIRIPPELIALLAGLALLPAIGKGLSDMLSSGADAQAGMLTFITTASGLVLWDIGSAFWGIVVGIVAVHAARLTRRFQTKDTK